MLQSPDDIKRIAETRVNDCKKKLNKAKSKRRWKIALVTLASIIIVAASVGILLLYFIGGPIGAAIGSILSWIGTGLSFIERGLSFLFSFAMPGGVASTIGSIISNVLIGITVLLGAASVGSYIRSILSNTEVKSLENELKEAEEIEKETEIINKALEEKKDKVFVKVDGVINITFKEASLDPIDSHAIGIVIENIASPGSSPLNLNLKDCNVTDEAAKQLAKIIADPNQEFNLKNIDLTGNSSITEETIKQLSKALEQNVTITQLSVDINLDTDINKNIIKQIVINNYLQQHNEQNITFDALTIGLTEEQKKIAIESFDKDLKNIKSAAKTKIEALKLLPPSSLSVCKEQQVLFEGVLEQNRLLIRLKKVLERQIVPDITDPIDALLPTIKQHPERFCTFVADSNNGIDANKIRQLIFKSSNILTLLALEPENLKGISKLLCGINKPTLAAELFKNMATAAKDNIQYQDKDNKALLTDLLKTALNDPSNLIKKLEKLEKKKNPKAMVKHFIDIYNTTKVERQLPEVEEDIKKLIGIEKLNKLEEPEELSRIKKLRTLLTDRNNSNLEELQKAKRKRSRNAFIFFGVLGIFTISIAIALAALIPIIQGIWKAISNIVAAVTTGAFLAADAGTAVGFWDKLSKFFERLSFKNSIGSTYRKIMLSEQITQLSENVKKSEIILEELNSIEQKITNTENSSTAIILEQLQKKTTPITLHSTQSPEQTQLPQQATDKIAGNHKIKFNQNETDYHVNKNSSKI
jgi:hypothetical protein